MRGLFARRHDDRRGRIYDKQVDLCQAETLESVGTLRGHKESVRSLLFLHDGKTLVSAGANRDFQPEGPNPPGELKLWDVAGLKERLSVDGYEAGVLCLALLPTARRWRLETWRTKAVCGRSIRSWLASLPINHQAPALLWSVDWRRPPGSLTRL